MPNISYDTTPDKSFVAGKPKLKLSINPSSFFKGTGKNLLVLLVFIGVSFLAAIIAGIIMALGGNITVANLDIIFDPQITIAYILAFYFLSSFYNLKKSQMYIFFLLSLFLSFSVNFIQGSILLVLLPPVLQKLRLIEVTEPRS